jgi:uncharacterized protein YndB with AHSA1/START domain
MKTRSGSIASLALWIVCAAGPGLAQEAAPASAGRVLRIETLLPVSRELVWRAFSTEQGLAEWVAPVVAIDLRAGGSLLTHYDADAAIGDPGTISTRILNVLEGELITFKVELNESFSERLQAEDGNLQEIVQIRSEGENLTRVVSSMVGWGIGPEWDATYNFFVTGNEWTYRQLREALTPAD